jgi:hypothetical protein
MKKVFTSMLAMSMMFFLSMAKADNLTVDQAKSIGTYYMAVQTGIDKLTPQDLRLAYQYENLDVDAAAAYVFNVGECGWIIVAGTTVVDPVIAYSEEGSFDIDAIPDNMRWWLKNYTDVVADVQRKDAEKGYPNSEKYNLLVNHGLNGTKDEKIILMNTRWDQGSPYNPSYNLYCPQVNGRYSVTGCVATALAQICKYYNYPVQPKGTVGYTWHGTQLKIKLDTVSFNYDLMPTSLLSLSGNITATADQIREVAKLNYCLGVAVHMDYDPDGSGASMDQAMSSMRYRFKYQQGTMRMRRGDVDTDYVNTIRNYLLAGDVLAMRGASATGGSDAAGHAWVVCGYKRENTQEYYMNWGWNGTGNGWYNLADNNMYISSMNYNFNLSQGCLFGMIPPEDSNSHHAHVSIPDVVDNTVLGTAYPNPATSSISLPYNTETAADMQVYSIDGKLIATQRVQPGSGKVSLRVDALPKGVYIYRMNSKNGKFIVK